MGKIKSKPFLIFSYVIIAVFLVIYLFPLFFDVNTALKTVKDFMRNPIGLTKTWAWENFSKAWNKGNFAAYILNSVLYTSVSTLASLLMSLFVAFPISRKYVPASGFLHYFFLCGMFLPSATIPLFQLILKMGLYNTRLGYILVMTGVNATSVFFFTGYFATIPRELDEAAVMDGCGYFRYLVTCVIPLSKPAIVSMGLLTMINVWNDIIKSLIYLSSQDKYTITRGLFAFQGQYSSDWTQKAAAMLIVAAPLIIVFIFCQRYIVSGITSGGVKS